ncbi:Membrane protein involved in aromatic hydrocarbon degradation [Candidatus Magnetomorum sp. HK-1]|nr:Membrane protein involved in aromatic hydrocarbon degradation [Candidatus Magnetomorum sp. HK-1]
MISCFHFKTFFLVFICALFCQLQTTNAQTNPFTTNMFRMEITSSLNPVGSGARAMGMGGAFIAVADDATAASWNPAGLIQLDEAETSFVFDFAYKKEGNAFALHPEADHHSSIDDLLINYFSIAYPFRIQKKEMVVSLNIQHLYNFQRDWQFIVDHDTPVFTSPVQHAYLQKGNIYAIGLAYSVQVAPDFSAGLTLNYNGKLASQNHNWEQQYQESGTISSGGILGTFHNKKHEEFSFKGFNINLGFLWRISEEWTLGGVLKTPYVASIDHSIETKQKITYPDSPASNVNLTNVQELDEKLRMPLSYGLGVACRLSDAFTISFDLYRTHWNNFEFEHETGIRTSPITGKTMNASEIDPTTWFRMGAEYQFFKNDMIIPVRGGIFYDPSPDRHSPDDFYGFTLGSGVILKNGIAFDAAYQFRTGNNVGSAMLENTDFSQDVREHKLYSSVIYYF